ncbi:MAG: hypothetical protein VKQ33_13235 [Candidatus Sericytochromatia bacterium]|nr:hypothetical protein [Candidatus Sericytochromatia bacterium]
MRGWRGLQALGLAALALAWLEVLLGCGLVRPPGPNEAGPLVLRAVAGAGPVTVRAAQRVDTGAPLAWLPVGPPGAWVQQPGGWVCQHPGPDASLRLTPPPGTPVRIVLLRGPGQGRCEVALGDQRWAVALGLSHIAEASVLADPRPSWLATPRAHALAALAALALGAIAWRGLPGLAWVALSGLSVAGLLGLVAAAGYPGGYTVDALMQLKQVLARAYSDHHPPVLAGLWRMLLDATGWLPALWLLHLGLVGAGLWAWGAAAWATGVRAGVLGLPALLATPVVLSCLGAMWKDVGFAGAMLLASGLVALAHVRGRFTAGGAIATMAALYYAANVRHNGLPAVLPLLWVASGLLPGPSGPRVAWRLVVVGAAAGGLLLGGKALDTHVLQARRTHLQQVVQLHDLAAIAVLAGKNHLPAYVREHPHYDERRMHEEYWRSIHVYAGANFLMIEGWPPPLVMTQDAAQAATLRHAWLAAIADAPGPYLQHRWWLFQRLMRPAGEAYVQPPRRPFRELEQRWALTHAELLTAGARTPEPPSATSARLAVLRWSEAWRGSRVYNGWLYLGLAAACLVLAARGRRHPLVPLAGMLAASALLYLGLYLFVTVWCEYRYLYWGGVASLLACWVLAVGLLAPRMAAARGG